SGSKPTGETFSLSRLEENHHNEQKTDNDNNREYDTVQHNAWGKCACQMKFAMPGTRHGVSVACRPLPLTGSRQPYICKLTGNIKNIDIPTRIKAGGEKAEGLRKPYTYFGRGWIRSGES